MNAPGKLLALDVSQARIGVATCDALGLTVRPLMVIDRTSRRADFARLAELVQRDGVTGIVCGLPLNMDGSEGPQAQMIRKWAMRLAQALRTLVGRAIPVVFWDERLTTYAAREWLATGPPRGWGNEAGEDAVAAAILLQQYLDAQRRGETADFGRIELPERDLTRQNQD
ncbi:MAG: Holliday junction resolvase RuvX [Caldilineaceae bacterium]|nr:Holliday junction resolvase RuvX [Caldilineaceae bacterium]